MAPTPTQVGLFQRFPVQAIYAMHNWPAMKPGTVGIVLSLGSALHAGLVEQSMPLAPCSADGPG